ncbi:putative hydro-lyase [Pseudoalteromonas sp. T1lg75]|uniref:putative hydro-lyase n=1 Tax=Pseudoalteromonas sp. T1lg75 TaxID=2077102 RepID=UPI000CF6E0A3|nr:putative hydro-lyase [Pseudoalteromonas sp. T1lg75]
MDANASLHTPADIRKLIRAGDYTGHTSGFAPGFVQANLVILPQKYAYDFLRFCQANPKSCPLLGQTEAGAVGLKALAEDLDIRTDLPKYRVFEQGQLVSEPTQVNDIWRDDLVSFLIGCSFSFEEALLADGIEIRNLSEHKNVPMYITNHACTSAGPFVGNQVVSMRPMTPKDAIRAIQICSRYPSVHGAPVHFGEPAAIGIKDINRPDFGEAVTIKDGEVPVFWACGVTPQVAISNARPDFCITHSPGHMLILDIKNTSLATL